MIEFGAKSSNVDYTHRRCIYGVCINEDSLVAAIKTPKGYFLIGGGIDEGESPISALAREALEETGMEIKILNKIGEAADYDSQISDDGNCYSRASHFYKVNFLKKVSTPIETDHELKWMTIDKALESLFFEGQRWAVKQCL